MVSEKSTDVKETKEAAVSDSGFMSSSDTESGTVLARFSESVDGVVDVTADRLDSRVTFDIGI